MSERAGAPEHDADLPFRQLAENLPAPCWISDEVGRIVWANRAWIDYTGYTVERIEAEGLKPLHDPRRYGDVVRKWTSMLAEGVPGEMRFPLRGRDGRLRPFHTRVFPLRDSEGRITRWFGTNSDVSGAVEAEARLRSSEEQWREVFERAGDAIFVTDPSGAIAEVNDAALAITGFARDELIGRSVFELVVEAERQPLAAARADEESVRDWSVKRKDGRIAHLEISSRRLSDGRRIGVARDVSARRLAELAASVETAQLRERASEAERRLKRFWDASRDLFAVASADDGRTKMVNGAAWEATLGYTEAELLKMRLFDLVHPDDVRATRAARRANLARDYEGFVNRMLAKDGRSVWLSWNIVRDEGLTYCSARDITADVAAREALERAHERLARAQRLETVGQLTGGVAHDFNNLMMVTAGHADLLRGRADSDPAMARSIEAIAGAAQRGQELTRRLLAFSRRQRLKPSPVMLETLIRQLQPLLASSLGAKAALEIDLPDDVWTVLVDAGELESALINMAVNARDAMPAGGVLRIVARNAPAHPVAGADASAQAFVEIAVSDTGCGIPPDLLDRVVEPYFTTKEVNQGTGLGLSQVDGFVQQSGGRMRIESALGQGTTIRIWLPRAIGAPAAEAPAVGVNALRRLGVLLVEDNPEVAEVTARLLEQLGHGVDVAGSATAALERLQAKGARPPDLLVSDVVMAGEINGLGLARRVRELYPHLPVLLVTGYSREAEVIGDAFPVLAKPYQLGALDRALRQALTTTGPAAG